MEAIATKLLKFLRKSPQFVIPIYQRTYSWTETDCRQLWDDIVRVGESEKVDAHFIGSIVYIEKGQYHVTTQSPLLVIDGQQRLATIALLINALAEALRRLDESCQEPVEGFSPRKLQNYYLLNPEESGEQRFKLILSQTDKSTLISILEGSEAPKEVSLNVAANYQLFQSWIAGRHGDLVPVCNGLAKLMVVDISLDRTQDNPQLIFESLNSTGRVLTKGDLIRNFVLMGLEPDLQARLYEKYWRPMEEDFGQTAYGVLFDGFMRYYLTVKTGSLPNLDNVYDAFKRYSRGPEVVESGVEAMVADLRSFARYFCAMALGAEGDPDLKTAFHDLRELKADVTYPLLLELYHDYFSKVLSRTDFVAAVRLLEAYVFRRAVCSIPTNSMDKTFAGFGKSLRKDRYLESIQANLLLLPSYRRMPSDEEFYRDLQTHDLYNFSRRSYWLRRLENYDRKERVTVDEFTIEHILPQNPDLPAAWREALGENWRQVQQTWLHTLGNLTLTGYNSEYSDRPFHEKRDMKGGFRDSPIRLNVGLGQLDKWNEQAIGERAARLAGTALQVWPVPTLSDDILAGYRKAETKAAYTVEDHPLLLASPTRELFEALRKEIRALDPNVVEEFLKQYVAYKAEGSFVVVVPRSNRLRLILSIPLADIDDPKGLCRDISGKENWGNGKVAVMLKSLEDLPYVMGLVRQTLEHWLSNGDSDK